MRKLHLEDMGRPLYLSHGLSRKELDLFFASEGDYFTTHEVVDAIRDELDALQYPVVRLSWDMRRFANTDLLCVSFSTEGKAEIPDELVEEIRVGVQVRCHATGHASVKHYLLDGRYLTSEIFIEIANGWPRTDIEHIEDQTVITEGLCHRILVPSTHTHPDIAAAEAAEVLGVFLRGNIEESTVDLTELPSDSDTTPTVVQQLAAPAIPDYVHEMENLWNNTIAPRESL